MEPINQPRNDSHTSTFVRPTAVPLARAGVCNVGVGPLDRWRVGSVLDVSVVDSFHSRRASWDISQRRWRGAAKAASPPLYRQGVLGRGSCGRGCRCCRRTRPRRTVLVGCRGWVRAAVDQRLPIGVDGRAVDPHRGRVLTGGHGIVVVAQEHEGQAVGARPAAITDRPRCRVVNAPTAPLARVTSASLSPATAGQCRGCPTPRSPPGRETLAPGKVGGDAGVGQPGAVLPVKPPAASGRGPKTGAGRSWRPGRSRSSWAGCRSGRPGRAHRARGRGSRERSSRRRRAARPVVGQAPQPQRPGQAGRGQPGEELGDQQPAGEATGTR
jgi:hypothetical protein